MITQPKHKLSYTDLSESHVSLCTRLLPSITLDRTNKIAQMMDRVDTKYVLRQSQLQQLISALKNSFAVLEIDDLRQFSYQSCYYDNDFYCYYQHHQGKRQRFKVRTRRYVDTGDQYFEIKLKGLRGRTVKQRYSADFLVSNEIPTEYKNHLATALRDHYNTQDSLVLKPSLLIDYARCTLVSLDGGERMTIDYNIKFQSPEGTDKAIKVGPEFIIVETKSARGAGAADRALRKLQIRKSKNLSKYCLGANLTGNVRKNNQFRSNIKLIQKNVLTN